jgi:hypothetical protein
VAVGPRGAFIVGIWVGGGVNVGIWEKTTSTVGSSGTAVSVGVAVGVGVGFGVGEGGIVRVGEGEKPVTTGRAACCPLDISAASSSRLIPWRAAVQATMPPTMARLTQATKINGIKVAKKLVLLERMFCSTLTKLRSYGGCVASVLAVSLFQVRSRGELGATVNS